MCFNAKFVSINRIACRTRPTINVSSILDYISHDFFDLCCDYPVPCRHFAAPITLVPKIALESQFFTTLTLLPSTVTLLLKAKL